MTASLDVLGLDGLLEDVLDGDVEAGEADGVLGELHLDLLRTDEKGLEVRQLALDLGDEEVKHLVDVEESLVPHDGERQHPGGEDVKGDDYVVVEHGHDLGAVHRSLDGGHDGGQLRLVPLGNVVVVIVLDLVQLRTTCRQQMTSAQAISVMVSGMKSE